MKKLSFLLLPYFAIFFFHQDLRRIWHLYQNIKSLIHMKRSILLKLFYF